MNDSSRWLSQLCPVRLVAGCQHVGEVRLMSAGGLQLASMVPVEAGEYTLSTGDPQDTVLSLPRGSLEVTVTDERSDTMDVRVIAWPGDAYRQQFRIIPDPVIWAVLSVLQAHVSGHVARG